MTLVGLSLGGVASKREMALRFGFAALINYIEKKAFSSIFRLSRLSLWHTQFFLQLPLCRRISRQITDKASASQRLATVLNKRRGLE